VVPKPAPIPPARETKEPASVTAAPPKVETPPSAVTQETIAPQPDKAIIEVPAMSSAELETYMNQTFIIRFLMDSNEFSDDAYDLMNSIVRACRQRTDLKVTVSGYTDSLGNYDYNRRLSEFRATVVKSYLVGQGIASARITTHGKGPESPIESNETREGRASNRRVEIFLSE
jgi:outer membrane protein OmpA-like peptidoglycan-associated protein